MQEAIVMSTLRVLRPMADNNSSQQWGLYSPLGFGALQPDWAHRATARWPSNQADGMRIFLASRMWWVASSLCQCGVYVPAMPLGRRQGIIHNPRRRAEAFTQIRSFIKPERRSAKFKPPIRQFAYYNIGVTEVLMKSGDGDEQGKGL